jgi:hypothetical protein
VSATIPEETVAGSTVCGAGSLLDGEQAASITTAIARKERDFIEIHLNVRVAIVKVIDFQNNFRSFIREPCE